MTERIPLVSLSAQHAALGRELVAALERALGSSQLILGPEVSAFEAEVAEYSSVRHAVGVSSGTDALVCALGALGIGPGDEVITTAYSFVASAEAIVRVGATPRFVDLAPGSFQLDPVLVAKAVNASTRAILPVHLFGHLADVAALGELARPRGLALVEDAAQAFGATWTAPAEDEDATLAGERLTWVDSGGDRVTSVDLGDRATFVDPGLDRPTLPEASRPEPSEPVDRPTLPDGPTFEVEEGYDSTIPALTAAQMGLVLPLGAVREERAPDSDRTQRSGPQSRTLVSEERAVLSGAGAGAGAGAGGAAPHAPTMPPRVGTRRAGTVGALGCVSFFPSKPLGALGDGGLVVTDDDALAERVRRLRQHGASAKHRYVELGGNYRLDALQAAFLRVKLPHLDDWLALRRGHAAAYSAALADVSGLELPGVAPGTEPAWAHYVVRVKDGRRDEVARALAAQGIETAVYYPTPLPLQPVFAFLGHRPGDFPEAERAAAESLALPLFPELTPEQRARVVTALRVALR